MDKKYLSEKVFVIHNFFDKNKLLLLNDVINDNQDWSFFNDQLVPGSHWYNNIKPLPENLFIELKKELLQFCKDNEITRGFDKISRYLKDGYMDPHDDGENETVTGGIVFYINDDYEGGEIYYPNLNLEYKPQKNDLIYHPAGEKYLHGVKPIKSGIRYVMTSFIKNNI